MTKILPFLTARYTILCNCRLQQPCDDDAVLVQWFSSMQMGLSTPTTAFDELIQYFTHTTILTICIKDFGAKNIIGKMTAT